MAKLELIGQAISKNRVRAGAKAGIVRINEKHVYLLMDRAGRQMEVKAFGPIGEEIVIRDARISGPSKVMTRLKHYSAIKKAITGAGLLNMFKSFGKD